MLRIQYFYIFAALKQIFIHFNRKENDYEEDDDDCCHDAHEHRRICTERGWSVDAIKSKVGFVAGVEGEYGVAENFGLTAGLFYSMQGVKFTNKVNGVDLTETDKVDFLNIPIMANYYVIPGLAVKAGIQPGFKVSGKRSIDAKEGSSKANLTEDLEGIKAFQFAIPLGASYEYKSFVLDARYNLYLTKAAKEAEGRHSVFTISLGYKFAL